MKGKAWKEENFILYPILGDFAGTIMHYAYIVLIHYLMILGLYIQLHLITCMLILIKEQIRRLKVFYTSPFAWWIIKKVKHIGNVILNNKKLLFMLLYIYLLSTGIAFENNPLFGWLISWKKLGFKKFWIVVSRQCHVPNRVT